MDDGGAEVGDRSRGNAGASAGCKAESGEGDRTGSKAERQPVSRRAVLAGATGLAGRLLVPGGATATTSTAVTPTDTGSVDTEFWMSDVVPDSPLTDICMPGTHHAAMRDCGANLWWHCQSHDVRTQLEDGIRYFDVRVGVYYSPETLVESGVAAQMSDEWLALFDEAGGPGGLVPDIGEFGEFEDVIGDLLDLLLDVDDPEWVAEKYAESCRDSGKTPEERVLSLDALLLRILASLWGLGFDPPTFGVDIDTIRLDRAADVAVDPDGFRVHHGGHQARPYDWGASLAEEFEGMRAYFEQADRAGANELAILEARQFWDLLTVDPSDDVRDAFETLVEDTFGEYLLDLGSYTPTEFGALSPDALDGPRVAVILDHGGDRPSWAGDGSSLPSNWPNEVQPGAVLTHGIGHVETSPHDSERLDRVGFQVTPDDDTIIEVTVADIVPGNEHDPRAKYTDLYEAAQRTNAVLDGYIEAVRRDPDQQPNVISLDYYETSDLVSACIDLSRGGFVGNEVVEDPPVVAADYVIESVGMGCQLGVDGGSVCGGDGSVWRLVPNDDGTYRLGHDGGGPSTAGGGVRTDADDVLAVANPDGGNGGTVEIVEWDGTDTQRWVVVGVRGHTAQFALVNWASGRALDIADGYEGHDDGTVQQWHLHAGANQRWRLRPVDGPLALPGFDTPTSADGLRYEDVTGSGGPAPTVADVQALFDNLDTRELQQSAEYFDFSGTGGDVTIFDVQALFNRL